MSNENKNHLVGSFKGDNLAVELHKEMIKEGLMDTMEKKPQMNPVVEVLSKAHAAGLVDKKYPRSYWQALITEAEPQVRQLVTQGKTNNLKYEGRAEPARRDEMEWLMGALLNRHDPIAIAVMKHFIWQVKRKLIGKKPINHMMPVIWGPGGTGKSWTIERLIRVLPEELVNTSYRIEKAGDDRYNRQLQDSFIIYFDELDGIKHASKNAVKCLITGELALTSRNMGSHTSTKYQHNATFIATTNDYPSIFMNDEYTNRRLFPIEVDKQSDFEKVNSTDFAEIWRQVDETQESSIYINGVAAQVKEAQQKLQLSRTEKAFLTAAEVKADETNTVKGIELYKEYCRYCEENRVPARAAPYFYSYLDHELKLRRHITTREVVKYYATYVPYDKETKSASILKMVPQNPK